MKLAIHQNKGSFSERWINYCNVENIEYKLVNCYESNIIDQMQECDALLWNWNNNDYKALKFARQLIYSLEQIGKKTFPNTHTCWHYDDKIGQKYLLEAIEAPFVATNIFYDKISALDWMSSTKLPTVFKLSSGSGATNVKLVSDEKEGIGFINKAFSNGFSQMDRMALFKDKYNAWKRNKKFGTLKTLLRSLVRIFVPTKFEKMHGREKGYVYFQEFIPNNNFDIRVITVGRKAFALKRMCRDGDFRASGSGIIIYDKEQIDERCVEIAINTSIKLDTQCTSYDFVFDENNNPLIVEISYAFLMTAYDKCQGYWDENLNWHKGKFNPQIWMIEDIFS